MHHVNILVVHHVVLNKTIDYAMKIIKILIVFLFLMAATALIQFILYGLLYRFFEIDKYYSLFVSSAVVAIIYSRVMKYALSKIETELKSKKIWYLFSCTATVPYFSGCQKWIYYHITALPYYYFFFACCVVFIS